MLPTVEVRWFLPGAMPEEVWAWFQEGRLVSAEPLRVDHYLRVPGSDAAGIKLREGRIELKVRTSSHGAVRFSQGAEGLVEAWRKWMLPLDETQFAAPWYAQPARYWTAVQKERWISALAVGTLPPRRAANQATPGMLELARVRALGDTWWTLGFEVSGMQAEAKAFLLESAQRVLEEAGAPRLGLEASWSYPRWLER
jgi:hypothetical protein